MRSKAKKQIILMSGVSDTTAPTVVITCDVSSPSAAATFNYTITFSEVVTGFEVGDFGITGGSKGALGGSGAVYTCAVTPTGNAPVVATVADGVAQDAAGNLNTAATPLSIGIIVTLTYQPDNTTGVDTYLDSGSPDTSQANNTQIRVIGTRRGLIKFPISLGAGASVQSGVLSVWQHETAPANLTISIARILAANSAWNESSTWNYKTPTSERWAGDTASDGGADAGCSVSGTDFSSTALGTFNHVSTDPDGTKYDVSLNASELSAMCANNSGLAIWVAGRVDFTLRSCEHATAAERPKLVIIVHYLP